MEQSTEMKNPINAESVEETKVVTANDTEPADAVEVTEPADPEPEVAAETDDDVIVTDAEPEEAVEEELPTEPIATYRIGFDKFVNNKWALRIRASEAPKIEIYTKSIAPDEITMRLDVVNICAVDYINRLGEYAISDADESSLMCIASYIKNDKCYSRIFDYSNMQDYITNLCKSHNVEPGKTLKISIIGVIKPSIPEKYIHGADFEDIKMPKGNFSTLEEYYMNDETLLCKLL